MESREVEGRRIGRRKGGRGKGLLAVDAALISHNLEISRAARSLLALPEQSLFASD